MTPVLLVVDSLKWAWGHMARGIQKYAPERYSVDVVDQSRLKIMSISRREEFLRYKAVCHFSWMEIPPKSQFYGQRLSTVVGSHGFEHNFPVDDPDDLTKIIATPIRNRANFERVLDRLDAVLCVSRRTHAACAAITDKACVCYPGVDVELFKCMEVSSGKLRVGWCGQKPEEGKNNTKGFREILLPLISRMRSRMDFIVNDRNAGSALTQEQMLRWYSEIDVLISTSCSEGCQMPILEAMSCGRPVVATAVGAADEIIRNGQSGMLVPAYKQLSETAGTIDAFERALSELDRNRGLLKLLGSGAASRIRKVFPWKLRAPIWLSAITDEAA